MLRKDLLRVTRRGDSYRPEFISRESHPLAAKLIGTYQGHVGEKRDALDDALTTLEQEADDFKLVRGLAALLDREATFDTVASVPPARARRAAFEAAETVGVASAEERTEALAQAATDLAIDVECIENSLYADRECNQQLVEFDTRWDPDTLIEQYNLSLAQTALFNATEVRIRSDDPKALIRAIKRLGLMYEIEQPADKSGSLAGQRTVVVTGPDQLFRRTRRYGTAFGRLLRSVATTNDWELAATVEDYGTERKLRLQTGDVSVPGTEPVAEPSYDSGVEREFAARFEALDLDWELHREPDLLEAADSVMIPDFAFDYKYGDCLIYFEVMGFWTPEYVESKLAKLDAVEDVELLVAVDESLGVGEAVEATDHRVISYAGSVRPKDVVDVLREYETRLLETAAAELPAEIRPAKKVVPLTEVAAEFGVAVDAIAECQFPDHRRIGQSLVKPTVLDTIESELEAGMSLAEAEQVLSEYELTDTSAVLSAVGYRVNWDGLAGGTVELRDEN